MSSNASQAMVNVRIASAVAETITDRLCSLVATATNHRCTGRKTRQISRFR